MGVQGMQGVQGVLEPRDRGSAGRTVAIAGGIAALVTVGFEIGGVLTGRIGSSTATLLQAAAIGLGLTALALVFWFRPERVPTFGWVGVAVVGVLVVVWAGLATLDASAAAQIGLVYPVVYAGAHLRARAAWSVLGLAVLADALVVLTLLPLRVAVPDLVLVSAALAMLTGVLVAVGRHQDALAARLETLASVDPLTGLLTRRAILGALAAAQETGTAAGTAGTGLLLVDLDQFKLLNDLYGHPVGDAALVHVGVVVGAVVPAGAVVVRLGGDELAVLLLETGREQVRAAAQAVLTAVRTAPLTRGAVEVPLSVSVGAAHRVGAPPRFDDLYAVADAALYRAKSEGRGRVVVA